MSKLFYEDRNRVNLCKKCQYAKDGFRDSCFCLEYGIIVTYGKTACNGYKFMRKTEDEKNEQTDDNRKPCA